MRTQAITNAAADTAPADPAKAHVTAYFREFVREGYAEWHALEDGIVQLRLHTGEIYLLESATVTRIA